MGNIMKVFLVLVIVLGMLALVGCQDQETDIIEGGTTTVPQDEVGETTQETTTEKPVNIVEDPLGNGEGDPLDAIDGTTGESGPVIDIEIEDDAETTTTAPTQGGSTGGNSGDNVTEPTKGDDGDDLVVDFDDLVNGGK